MEEKYGYSLLSYHKKLRVSYDLKDKNDELPIITEENHLFEGNSLPVSEVVINCTSRNNYSAWKYTGIHINLSRTVERVIINCDKGSHLAAEDCDFYVDSNNHFLSSYKGSLLSKDMKTLYFLHWNEEEQPIIPNSVENIEKNAVYSDNRSTELEIPEFVSVWQAGSICGYFSEIIFKGKLCEIEDNALSFINLHKNHESKISNEYLPSIFINNYIVNLQFNKAELKAFAKSCHVFFKAPEPICEIDQNSGLIILAKALSTEEKIEYNIDYTRCYLNPYSLDVDINAHSGKISGIQGLSIDNVFTPTIGSRVHFYLIGKSVDASFVDVIEDAEAINRLIGEALSKRKQ